MTISQPNQLVFSYQGDGATTVFAYPVRFLDQDELVVVSRDQFGTDTAKTLDMDYTVTGAGDANGGSITMLYVPGADETIVIRRATEAKQIVDLKDKQANPAEAVEQQLDRLAMVSQDHGQRIGEFEDSVDDLDASVAAAAASAAAAATSETNSASSATQAGLDADRAEAAAAGVNLPAILSGDFGKQLSVKQTEDGYELVDPGPISARRYGIKANGVADDDAKWQDCVMDAGGRTILIDGLQEAGISSEITLPSMGLHLRGNGNILADGVGNLFKAGTLTTTDLDFTATAGQTVFSAAYPYSAPYVEVFVNGLLKDHRTYSWSYDGTNLIVTFITGGATAGDAVQVQASEVTAEGLDGFAQVIIGAGVRITTTRVNEGRAFLLGWPDSFSEREHVHFLMEPSAEILGADGTKGFKNAVWLDACQCAFVYGSIYGIGANLAAATESDYTTCYAAIKATGQYTPSILNLIGGQSGFVRFPVEIGEAAEGLNILGYTFLKVGRPVRWVTGYNANGGAGRSFDVGFTMLGSHANCVEGGILLDGVSEFKIGNNLIYQNTNSTAAFFDFVRAISSKDGKIHGNTFRSYAAATQCVGVKLDNAATAIEVQRNTFRGADATASYQGVLALSGSSDCVIGPNTYKNVSAAVTLAAGSTRHGLLTDGDLFDPPLVTSPDKRYNVNNSTHWWKDKKWLVLENTAAQSVPNNTITAWAFAESRDPGSVYSGGTLTAPEWASRVRFKGRFSFAANTTGVRFVRVLRNGTETDCKMNLNAAPTGMTIVTFDEEFGISPGDTFDIQVWQNSGAALDLNASELNVLFV